MTKSKIKTKLKVQSVVPTMTNDIDVLDAISDKEQIKLRTKKYKDCSIEEAFAQEYGLKLKKRRSQTNISTKPTKNSLIDVQIVEHEDGKVELFAEGIKEPIIATTRNFPYFKHGYGTMKGLVVETTDDYIKVDVIEPIIEKWIQEHLYQENNQPIVPKVVVVRDLKMVKGGFIGKATINELVHLSNKANIEVFVPGSQIGLNQYPIYQEFEGKTVECLLTSTTYYGDQRVFIASNKEFLKLLGKMNLIDMFKEWCATETWHKSKYNKEYEAITSGTLYTMKVCGVFVEVPELSLIGMINMPREHHKNYQTRKNIKVKLKMIEEPIEKDVLTGETKHLVPYLIEDGVLKSISIRPIFELV